MSSHADLVSRDTKDNPFNLSRPLSQTDVAMQLEKLTLLDHDVSQDVQAIVNSMVATVDSRLTDSSNISCKPLGTFPVVLPECAVHHDGVHDKDDASVINDSVLAMINNIASTELSIDSTCSLTRPNRETNVDEVYSSNLINDKIELEDTLPANDPSKQTCLSPSVIEICDFVICIPYEEQLMVIKRIEEIEREKKLINATKKPKIRSGRYSLRNDADAATPHKTCGSITLRPRIKKELYTPIRSRSSQRKSGPPERTHCRRSSRISNMNKAMNYDDMKPCISSISNTSRKVNYSGADVSKASIDLDVKPFVSSRSRTRKLNNPVDSLSTPTIPRGKRQPNKPTGTPKSKRQKLSVNNASNNSGTCGKNKYKNDPLLTGSSKIVSDLGNRLAKRFKKDIDQKPNFYNEDSFSDVFVVDDDAILDVCTFDDFVGGLTTSPMRCSSAANNDAQVNIRYIHYHDLCQILDPIFDGYDNGLGFPLDIRGTDVAMSENDFIQCLSGRYMSLGDYDRVGFIRLIYAPEENPVDDDIEVLEPYAVDDDVEVVEPYLVNDHVALVEPYMEADWDPVVEYLAEHLPEVHHSVDVSGADMNLNRLHRDASHSFSEPMSGPVNEYEIGPEEPGHYFDNSFVVESSGVAPAQHPEIHDGASIQSRIKQHRSCYKALENCREIATSEYQKELATVVLSKLFYSLCDLITSNTDAC